MYVQVERGGYVGVTKNDADGLVVAMALDAACGKTVAQAMKLQRRHAELRHQPHVVVAVCAGLNGMRLVAYHVVVAIDNLFQRAYHCHQCFAEGYLTGRVYGLGSVDYNLSVFRAVILNQIYPFHCALHSQHGAFHIEVAPFQSANLADAKSCSETDVDAEVSECEVTADVVKNLAMVGSREHFHFLLVGGGRIFDVPLAVLEIAKLYAMTDNHFQNDEYVLDVLLTQSRIQALYYKGLHIPLRDGLEAAKGRNDLILNYQRIG